MNATEKLIKKGHAVILSVEKHGRRAEYKLQTINANFTLNVGSGHNTLQSEDAKTPVNFQIFSNSFTPDNVRFGLTDEEIISILNFN